LVGIIGIVFPVLSAASCSFVEIGQYRTGDDVGIFIYRKDDGQCGVYDNDFVKSTATLQGARTAAVLAPIFASFGMFIQLTDLCMCTICCMELLISFAYSFAAIAQGLTFIFFSSNVW